MRTPCARSFRLGSVATRSVALGDGLYRRPHGPCGSARGPVRKKLCESGFGGFDGGLASADARQAIEGEINGDLVPSPGAPHRARQLARSDPMIEAGLSQAAIGGGGLRENARRERRALGLGFNGRQRRRRRGRLAPGAASLAPGASEPSAALRRRTGGLLV